MKRIGNSSFSYCSSLISIIIPNRVTSIGFVAFLECDSITSITIPNSLTSIDEGVFEACKKPHIFGTINPKAENYAKLHGIPFTDRMEQQREERKRQEERKRIEARIEAWQ